MTLRFLLLVVAAVLSNQAGTSLAAAAQKKDLYFSFITALSGGSTSSGGIPIIDFALEMINNDSRLLPDYNLQYTTVLDSKVYYYSYSKLQNVVHILNLHGNSKTACKMQCILCSLTPMYMLTLRIIIWIFVLFCSAKVSLHSRAFFSTLTMQLSQPMSLWCAAAALLLLSPLLKSVTTGMYHTYVWRSMFSLHIDLYATLAHTHTHTHTLYTHYRFHLPPALLNWTTENVSRPSFALFPAMSMFLPQWPLLCRSLNGHRWPS